MIDRDALHAVLQYPVAVVELTAAVAMVYRWRWATRRERQHDDARIDPAVTVLLAVFLALIGIKQGYWAIWGAIKAADLHVVAGILNGHWWPVANNGLLIVSGVALIGRIGLPALGRWSYGLSGAAGCLLVVVAVALIHGV